MMRTTNTNLNFQMTPNVQMRLNERMNLNVHIREDGFLTSQIVSQTRTRCPLCGFAEIRTDEVMNRGVVFLAECPRCENRWTSREPIGRPVAQAAPAHAATAIKVITSR